MKISLIIDDKSWLNQFVPTINNALYDAVDGVQISLFHQHEACPDDSDIVFLLSYSRIVEHEFLHKFKRTIVIHSSALPKGRGMSPMAWQVLDGRSTIPITLLKASEAADAGDILYQECFELDGHELLDELRAKEVQKAIELMVRYVTELPEKPIQPNDDTQATYFGRRTPACSELDINKTLAEQFNLLRIVDNDDYPAFFYINGYKYIVKITKET